MNSNELKIGESSGLDNRRDKLQTDKIEQKCLLIDDRNLL